MPDTALIVPIDVDALAVNQGVLNRDGEFRWWPYNYQALADFNSPEPEAFGRQTGTPSSGVYLHWTLPRALRHGEQDRAGAAIEYPLVPNRWLVVREVGGAGAAATTAWVIESDCPLTDGVKQRFPDIDVAQMSMYLVSPSIVDAWKKSGDTLRSTISLDPVATDPQVANLGVRFPLAAGWTERAADTTFLTAMAPGNPVFSIYYPHNVGVFSMHDDLEGVDAGTLSYLVVGWYSNPDDDILASWQKDTTSEDAYTALLERLRWTVAGDDPADRATRSLYEGLALSIDWDRAGDPPPEDPLEAVRESGKLNVAVGNDTIDAFTALVGEQLEAAGHSTQTVKLLRAFQYDLLPVINEVNGDALLEEAIRKEWFGSEAGGYAWDIVARSSDGSAGVELAAAEAAWLGQLNRDQAALDAALRELFGLQWRFSATWWKLGLDPDDMFPVSPPGVTNAKLKEYLDPANPNGITAGLLAQYRAVAEGLGKVPQPVVDGATDPQDAFLKGIQSFAQARGLDASKVLKAVASPRFWAATNPVIVIAGVEPAPATDPDESLVVRSATELVGGFTFGGRTVDASAVSSSLPSVPDVAALPPEVPALLTELFFVDPMSASALAAPLGAAPGDVATAIRAHAADNYAAPLPALGLDAWMQPWNPMYVEWKVRYTHIPYEAAGHRNWTFDGTDYRYTPADGSGTEDREVGGISLLSPHAQFVFGTRLKEFLKKYPNADLTRLEEWIAQIDDWKFLAQELTGLNELLALRDPRAFRRPGPKDTIGTGTQPYPVAELAGFPTDEAPGGTVLPGAFQGQVDSVPHLPNGPALAFHGVRQGQIYFEELAVYDKFGRRLWVIESSGGSGLFDAKNFPLVRDAALLPDKVVHSEIAAVAQLPPRVLQHGRLDFRLVDGKDDSKTFELDDGVSPIAGWVLPNHLDGSILLYGPDGASLGEYRLVVGEDGTKRGEWQPPPHSDIATLDDVGRVAPHLKRMIEADAIGRQADFEAFLEAIDETLWTIDPLGGRHDQNLSVLVGRPLAVVRARLGLRLRGPAIRDTGWSATFDPPDPEFLDYRFAIRLGDQPTRQDGVIGYYLGDDYGTFNSVAAPRTTASQSYVKPIGPVGGAGGGNYIELQFNENSVAYVTALADPRAAMHAVTGILPIKRVDIPAGFVQRALSNTEIGFRLGPLLTRVGATPAQGGVTPAHPNAVGLPAPAEQNGSWSWWEREAGETPGWTGYDLVATTPNAKLKGIPNTLREGMLQLVIDLNEK